MYGGAGRNVIEADPFQRVASKLTEPSIPATQVLVQVKLGTLAVVKASPGAQSARTLTQTAGERAQALLTHSVASAARLSRSV